MSLMLAIGIALPSFNHVSAESPDVVERINNEVEQITDEEFDHAVQVIKNGLFIENGVYKFDSYRVGENNLTDEQINILMHSIQIIFL